MFYLIKCLYICLIIFKIYEGSIYYAKAPQFLHNLHMFNSVENLSNVISYMLFCKNQEIAPPYVSSFPYQKAYANEIYFNGKLTGNAFVNIVSVRKCFLFKYVILGVIENSRNKVNNQIFSLQILPRTDFVIYTSRNF